MKLKEGTHRHAVMSKADTVVLALQKLVRKRRIEDLKKMMGSVHLDIDVSKSRRRPGRRP